LEQDGNMTIIEQIEKRSSALKTSEVAKLLEVTRQQSTA
jgi:hypothetical protein